MSKTTSKKSKKPAATKKAKSAKKVKSAKKAKPAKESKIAKECLTENEEESDVNIKEDPDEDFDENLDKDINSGKSGSPSSESMMPSLSDTQVGASMKNFRNHPDMENFYRFIHENDLRIEALQIINRIIADRLINPINTKIKKKTGKTV